MTGCCENKKTIYFVQWTKLKLFYQLQRQWCICSLNLYPQSPVILGTFCMCCKPTGVARCSTLFKSSSCLVVIEPWIQKCAFYAVANRQKRSVVLATNTLFSFLGYTYTLLLYALQLCGFCGSFLTVWVKYLASILTIDFNIMV